MSWSSLPLIEMDEVNVRKQSDESRNNSRLQSRDTSSHLEKDIGKQLSALRQQSRTGRDQDDDKPAVDEFGRDIRRKATSKRDQEGEQVSQERESSRRRERSRSPRRWRDDDDDRGRDRNRGRDWGRDEPRRRGRDDYQSDGSNDSWEGGRAGERYRDWPRGREPDRYRERRDYRDRDDREWRRDRWEDRDDDRRRDYRDRYRQDEDRYWSENRSRDRYHDDRDYHHHDYHQEPSEIVMLKGLPTSVEDTQIHEILGNAKLPYKDVRVVKTREGYSRGFAFVEFLDMETAKKWIEECKGKLIIEDVSVIMDFSRSKMAIEPHRDWVCSKCGTQNFSSKRRNSCFTCNAPKDENDETKELGSTPCKVLILRGLDILTTEETIRQSLASFTSTPIFDVRLIKDKLTGTSRGFCFVELGSIEEATQLMEELQSASFKIDEKVLLVSYAKFGTNPSKPGTVAVGSCSSSAPTSVSETSTTSSTTSQSRSNNNFAANAIAQARAAAQMGHTTDPVTPQTAGSMDHYSTAATYTSGQSATTAVQDAAVSSGVPSEPSSVSTSENPTPAIANPVSSYVYDAASGYYYDTTTGLYYDPNTQYYYNSTTQQYMYWDATTQQYVTVISSASETSAATSTAPAQPPGSEPENTSNKEKQKKAKSLNAKKIAKDMERWAKKQAKNKEATRPQATVQTTQEAVKESTYQYDPNDLKAGIKMNVAGSSNLTSLATSSPLAALSELDDPADTAPTAAASSLVAEYGDDSGGEEDSKEDNFTDWTKMACLLCKRQFPTKEALSRHIELSDLHKQNLLVQKKLKMSFTEIDDYEKQQREAKYRDRARERRELFGQPDSAPAGGRKRKKGKISYEQPTKDGITSDNIGNKMLQAMGWTAGTGLGKDRQGIVDPILAKMRNRTAGLGLKGSDYGATAGDSERDLLKKMAQSRYDD